MFHVKHAMRTERRLWQLVRVHAKGRTMGHLGIAGALHIVSRETWQAARTTYVSSSRYPARHGGTSQVFTHSHSHTIRFAGSSSAYSTPAVNGSTCVCAPTFSR